MIRSALVCGLIFVSFGTAVAQSADRAVAAYEAGDYQTALALARPLAEQGDTTAMNLLGVMSVSGRGVPQSYFEAARWFRSSALRGDAAGQKNLGLLYADGLGVSKDDAEALRWFLAAAKQGLAEAQYNVGVSYVAGRGTTKDYAEAYRWFSRAAEKGDVGSLYYVGSMHINGHGTSQDYVLAFKWLSLAAERGHERAKAELVFLKPVLSRSRSVPARPPARGRRRFSAVHARGPGAYSTERIPTRRSSRTIGASICALAP